jgi:hemerythrin
MCIFQKQTVLETEKEMVMTSTLIQWDDRKMSVNIEEIDRQHKALVGLINNLFDVVKAGRSNEIFEKLISDLIRYTEFHFSDEENYFKQYNYPEAKAHMLQHKEFIDKVSLFKKDFDSGKTGLTRKVLDFLRDWLVEHIMGTDKKYSKFFNDLGLR